MIAFSLALGTMCAPASAGQTNVAYGKPVSPVQGSYSGIWLERLVDCVFLERGHRWASDTVW
ncbi:MAG: hypothetical protein DYG94_04665 [Leptolyngbya sp. PLA3]|nr:MAG: hypothetical protein EDM82_03815 [Cyanobacteria bacterium CYA]MCE7968024.1 hypothetical protein [Leptolyngbya sp. PL-A3]